MTAEKQRLAITVALVIAFACAVAGAAWMLRDSAMETSRSKRSGSARDRGGLLKLQIDEETGVRGYVIDRNGSFLQPYREAEARIGRVIRAEQSALNRMNAAATHRAAAQGGSRPSRLACERRRSQPFQGWNKRQNRSRTPART